MKPLRIATASVAVAGLVAAGVLLGGMPATSAPPAKPPAPAPSPTAYPPVDATQPTPVTIVEKLTGPDAPNNTWGRWDIKGTDLGIMWDDGDGRILMALGDTFGNAWTGPGGGAPPNGNWRSNVLVRSSDRTLADGMLFESAPTTPAGIAKELIPSKKINGDEMTTIPTAGISVGKRQYMGFMSVKQWGPPGLWDTNYAGIAYSDDDGENWTVSDARWENNADGTDPFQMQAWVRKGNDVYVYGTPNGRVGAAHVAKVPAKKLLDPSAYRYWNGSSWVKDRTQAAAVVAAPMSELSVFYDSYSKRYLMMTLSGLDVVLRTATSPEGPWSAPQLVASHLDYPALYGGYFHPWSKNGEIYFALSQWEPYNVYLMRMQIDRSGTIVNPNLVADTSFERQAMGDGTGGTWGCSPNCGIDEQPGRTFTGAHQAFVRYNSGWRNVWQDVAVEPNTAYRVTGWVRTSANSDAGFFGARTTSQTVLGEAHIVAHTGWTKMTVDFDSGANDTVQLFSGVWTNSGDIWMQLDDVSLIRR